MERINLFISTACFYEAAIGGALNTVIVRKLVASELTRAINSYVRNEIGDVNPISVTYEDVTDLFEGRYESSIAIPNEEGFDGMDLKDCIDNVGFSVSICFDEREGTTTIKLYSNLLCSVDKPY